MSTVAEIHAEYIKLGNLESVLSTFVESNIERRIDFSRFCHEEMKKKDTEKQPWEIALDRIREHACEILSKHFKTYSAIYSAYKNDEHDLAVDNLDEIAIAEDGVTVVYGTISGNLGNGDVYESQELDHPTWADLLVEFEKAIRYTGDYHHVFLESVSKNKKGQWEMWSGS